MAQPLMPSSSGMRRLDHARPVLMAALASTEETALDFLICSIVIARERLKPGRNVPPLPP